MVQGAGDDERCSSTWNWSGGCSGTPDRSSKDGDRRGDEEGANSGSCGGRTGSSAWPGDGGVCGRLFLGRAERVQPREGRYRHHCWLLGWHSEYGKLQRCLNGTDGACRVGEDCLRSVEGELRYAAARLLFSGA